MAAYVKRQQTLALIESVTETNGQAFEVLTPLFHCFAAQLQGRLVFEVDRNDQWLEHIRLDLLWRLKRLIQRGKETETLIDATQGRRTKSVIFTENNKIIL